MLTSLGLEDILNEEAQEESFRENREYGQNIAQTFADYKARNYIKKGDCIDIEGMDMQEVAKGLESLFGKGMVSCHTSVCAFDLNANAFVYEKLEDAKLEMVRDEVLECEDQDPLDMKMPGTPKLRSKVSAELLISSHEIEEEEDKYQFFYEILKAPKGKEYAVLSMDLNPMHKSIIFHGTYKLCAVESCIRQRVVMKLTKDIFDFSRIV